MEVRTCAWEQKKVWECKAKKIHYRVDIYIETRLAYMAPMFNMGHKKFLYGKVMVDNKSENIISKVYRAINIKMIGKASPKSL